MNRSVSLLSVAVVLLLFAAAPASGQKVTISNTVIVAADVFTDHNVQDTFGAYLVDFGKLKVGKYDDNVKSIAYLKFFLKSLPQNPINYFPLYGSNKTATLRLWYIPQWGYSPRDLYIYGITANPFAGEGDNWQEGNLVSNDPPPWYIPDNNYMNWYGQPIPLGDPVLLGVIPQGDFPENEGFVSCSLNMDWILDEWDGDKVLTLKLMVSDSDPEEGKMYFYSKDHLNPSTNYMPRLILSYDSLLYDAVKMPIQNLQQNTISNLDSTVFKNSTMKHAMINKLSSVAANIEAGNYQEALGQLKNDLLAKTDGCHNSGAPDKNDWIKDCATQSQVHAQLDSIIKILEQMQ